MLHHSLGKRDIENNAEHNGNDKRCNDGDDHADQDLFLSEARIEQIEQKNEDHGSNGKAHLVDDKDVAGKEDQRSPKLYLVVAVDKESAGLCDKGPAFTNSGKAFRNDDRQKKYDQNAHNDPGNDPVLC